MFKNFSNLFQNFIEFLRNSCTVPLQVFQNSLVLIRSYPVISPKLLQKSPKFSQNFWKFFQSLSQNYFKTSQNFLKISDALKFCALFRIFWKLIFQGVIIYFFFWSRGAKNGKIRRLRDGGTVMAARANNFLNFFSVFFENCWVYSSVKQAAINFFICFRWPEKHNFLSYFSFRERGLFTSKIAAKIAKNRRFLIDTSWKEIVEIVFFCGRAQKNVPEGKKLNFEIPIDFASDLRPLFHSVLSKIQKNTAKTASESDICHPWKFSVFHDFNKFCSLRRRVRWRI